jgi:tetratricopeptide (TPR) repeat protein
VIGGTPPGIPAAARAATVRQPMGPPTPPATEWQPMGPPTPAPVPAPARRSRWPLILGAVAVGLGVLLILAVVGVLVLGIENPLTGIQVARDLKDAQAALDVGDYAGAAEGFGQVLETDPEHAEATDGLLEAADNLAQAGQFDDAIGAYDRVWQVRPDEIQALRGLGQAYAAQGEWNEAASWYEKWVQVTPDDSDALLALGWAEYRLERYESAVAQFSRARELAPDQPAIWLGLGRAYLAQGDYSSSLESAEQALDLAPDGSSEQDQAVQIIEELAEADSGLGPWLALSDWYAGQGNEAELQRVNGRIMEQIPRSMDVTLGDQIRLLGYEIRDLPDNQVRVDLYFQAAAFMEADYAIWLHNYVHKEDVALLPPDRQQYGFVGGGYRTPRPTSQWFERAIYQGSAVRDLAAGDYRFVFGLWLPDPETRLATPDDPKGAVDLGWHLVGAAGLDARVFSRHGWEKLENDELDEAQEAFEAALEKEPDNLDALLGASAAYGAQGASQRLAEINSRLLSLVPNQQDVPIGELMCFVGYDIQTLAEGQVQVDLYFRAVASTDADYAVWLQAHVDKEDVALLPPERQRYGFAAWGHSITYPTSRWAEGAIYRDRTVREALLGEYHLVFGVWLPNSETRLATPDDPEGAVDLGWHMFGGE